jgi:hypothetical protein
MPVTRDRILQLLDAEEPDYRAAAAEAGTDSFDVLLAMVQEGDPWTAGLAASLAARLAADPAVADGVTPVLEQASQHTASSVRAAAALGASRAGAPAQAVTDKSLNDPDPGVRALAFRGLSTPLPPETTHTVQVMAAADPAPVIQEKAAALAARIPDPDLPGELLAEVSSYILARLNELAADALGGVAALTAALGRPAFPDPGGAVANLLAQAQSQLRVAAARLAAGDHKAAALQIGLALKAVSDACIAVGGSLVDLLNARMAWGAASGLAGQLGFTLASPKLRIDGDALFHEISADGRSLGLPILLAFDKAVLTTRLALGGTGPALTSSLAFEGLAGGLGGPLSALLGGATGAFSADATLGVDSDHGLTLGASASPRLVLPAHPKLGPIDVRELVLEIPGGAAGEIDLGSTISTKLGGVVGFTIEGAGLALHLDPAGGTPVTAAFKPPTGIGVIVDTGLVRGGGFLAVRPDGFGGALDLRIGPVEVKAVGLVTTDPFALVVVMSVEFVPAIDLTFGFTLNAVGGVIGIEHRLDSDALRAGIGSGALDHILFPPDPVAAAPAILNTLAQVFPVDRGSVVIGPMVEIGWGRPISFVIGQLGVILSLPDGHIVIVGRLKVGLPAPELPIVDLRAVVLGEVTPDELVLTADLEGSRIAGFSVSGGIGLMLRWGGQADFAISAGGFHPRYDPPAELAGLQRLAIDLSPPAVLTLRAQAYFALTTNSLQLGARVEAGGDIGVADISGHFGFDAMVLFSPHFAFTADADAAFAVHVLGQTVAGVHVQLHLEGPTPWRAEGHAEVDVLFASVAIDVGPLTWGDADNPPPAEADPRQLVHDALSDPASWQALAPPDSGRVVKLQPAPPSQTEATVDPMGLLDARQHAVPLERVITHVGPNPVPEDRRRVYLGVPLLDATPAGAISEVDDLFSPGQFLDLTEDQKLSRPSFEPMPAGARIRPPGESADWAGSRGAELKYETFVCDDDAMAGIKAVGKLVIPAAGARLVLAAGAAGSTSLRAGRRYAKDPDPIHLAHSSEVVTISKATAAADPASWAPYSLAAEQLLSADVELARLGAV